MGIVSYGTKAAIEHKLHEHAVKSGVTKAGAMFGGGTSRRSSAAGSRTLTAAQRNKEAARAVYQATFGGKPPPARLSARGMMEAVKGATAANLRTKAVQRGIVGAARMTKPQLIAALYAPRMAPAAMTLGGRVLAAAAMLPAARVPLMTLAAGSVVAQALSTYRQGYEDNVAGLPNVASAANVGVVGSSIVGSAMLARAVGLPLMGTAALASVVGTSMYRDAKADSGSALRGAGRGLVRALDPTQIVMDKGVLLDAYDRTFGKPSWADFMGLGKPARPAAPDPAPFPWPMGGSGGGRSYLSPDAQQRAGGGRVEAPPTRLALRTDGITDTYVRVQSGRVVTVAGYRTPDRRMA